jgi:branched-chain amino acid transport system ATP-binding protein
LTLLLQIDNLAVSYGAVPAVRSASLKVHHGDIVVILGANGAGKTTIIKSVLGLVKPKRGSIQLDGTHDLLKLKPHQIHALGIAWVPEGRQLWNTLTVMDNLRLGAFTESDTAKISRRIDEVFTRFPRLAERRYQVAGSLSGGEQQMVAIARALVAAPRLLLMDEPSLGLAPMVVRDVMRLVQEINGVGISVLMVEQNARQALKVATSAYLLEVGTIVESGAAKDIATNEHVQAIFLGGEA